MLSRLKRGVRSAPMDLSPSRLPGLQPPSFLPRPPHTRLRLTLPPSAWLRCPHDSSLRLSPQPPPDPCHPRAPLITAPVTAVTLRPCARGSPRALLVPVRVARHTATDGRSDLGAVRERPRRRVQHGGPPSAEVVCWARSGVRRGNGCPACTLPEAQGLPVSWGAFWALSSGISRSSTGPTPLLLCFTSSALKASWRCPRPPASLPPVLCGPAPPDPRRRLAPRLHSDLSPRSGRAIGGLLVPCAPSYASDPEGRTSDRVAATSRQQPCGFGRGHNGVCRGWGVPSGWSVLWSRAGSPCSPRGPARRRGPGTSGPSLPDCPHLRSGVPRGRGWKDTFGLAPTPPPPASASFRGSSGPLTARRDLLGEPSPGPIALGSEGHSLIPNSTRNASNTQVARGRRCVDKRHREGDVGFQYHPDRGPPIQGVHPPKP